MTTVAHSRPFVVGVDTHAKTHTYAVIETGTGQLLGCQQFPTTPPGIARAISWAGRVTGGQAETLWSIEGVATYGARVARAAAESGYEVVEAPRISARTRRGIGKSDPLDAHAIAAAVLPLEEKQLRRPRADDGTRQALRVLVAARDQMAAEKTVNVNALTALLRTNDLGIDARKPLTAAQIGQASRWQKRTEPIALATARAEAVRLARRIVDLQDALTENHARMTELIAASPAAPLLQETGVGAYTAAVVITAWSHPGRVRNDAAFASLAGMPAPRIQRQHDPAPAEPGRGSAPEQGAPLHRDHANESRPRHQGLPREAARRRMHPTRDPTLHQALPRPTPLPNPQRPLRPSPRARLELHPRSDNRLAKRGGDDSARVSG